MNDLMLWSTFIGAVLPPLIALVNQATWSPAWRFIVAVITSIITAGVTVWLRGEFNPDNWFRSALVVALAAIATYHAGWKPSGIAPAIEVATSARR